uniref:Uncharacterized protein n=1 Tax=Rhizophora mucronata TaxID=61149 RepID=A0A2P2PC79_RHIMU
MVLADKMNGSIPIRAQI